MTIFDARTDGATELDRYRGAVGLVTDVASRRGSTPRRTGARHSATTGKPFAC